MHPGGCEKSFKGNSVSPYIISLYTYSITYLEKFVKPFLLACER